MDILQAMVLGVIQGVAEFLPISSSAHLVLVPRFFGWEEHDIYFDAMLHAGTLLSLILFFWKDLVGLLKNRSLLGKVIIATIPAGIFGLLFINQIESLFKSNYVIVIMLVGVGIVMLIAEWYVKHISSKVRDLKYLRYKDVLFIGFMQALALIRGTSRSGITISAGMFSGLGRESAARFSFLIGIPIIGAATLKALWEIGPSGEILAPDVLLGATVAFVTGYFVIKYFIKYLGKHTLIPFVIYRFILAAIILVVLLS